MTLYEAEPWHDVFVASAGAAAALAGLVFVAVSINIGEILKTRGTPERGLQTVLILVAALVVSLLCLIPQRSQTLGVELVLASAVLIAVVGALTPAAFSGTRGHPGWWLSRLLLLLPSCLPYLAAGISLIAAHGGGLAWVIGGVIAAVIAGVISAWVLLVEILR